MNRLVLLSIRRPKLVILLAFLATASVSPGLLQLRLRTDGHALVPARAPEIVQDAEIRERFGLEDPIIVSIHADSPGGIFNAQTLGLNVHLTEAFLKIEGVREAHVVSLATEVNDRVWPGSIRFRRFLEPLPQTSEELSQLRADLMDVKLYTGTLVSADEKSTSLLVRVPRGADRLAMIRQMGQIISFSQVSGNVIEIIGAPVAEALLGTHILEDLGVPSFLLGHRTFGEARASFPPRSLHETKTWIAQNVGLAPLAILLMALIFLVMFRSTAGVFMPLIEVGACLVFVFAVMGWLGIPIYLTIAVMPIILTAAGVTDEIHIFTHYTRALRARPVDNPIDILTQTMQELTAPVVMAAITTAIGFLSFTFSEIRPVQAFGWMTSLGILFCMFWSLTVIPAMLALLPRRRLISKSQMMARTAPSGAHFFQRLADLALRFRWPVIAGTFFLAFISVAGIKKIEVQDSWVDGFAEQSDFHQATMRYNRQFFGGHVLLLSVESERTVISGKLTTEDLPKLLIRFPKSLTPDPKSLIGQRIHLKKLAPLEDVVTDQRAANFISNWYSWITDVTVEADALVVSYKRNASPVHFLRMKPGEVVDFDITSARMMEPATMERIAGLEEFIRGRTGDAVGGVIGIADYVTTINYLSRGRKPEERIIPDSSERIEWLWGEYNRIRGTERMRQLVDEHFTQGMVTILMKNANFVGTSRLMEAIREYEREHLAPHGLKLAFGGDVGVSQTLIGAIVGTQIFSVIGSLVGDLLVTTILGRSLVFGLLCILPSSLAVLLNFAVMGWLGVPLGVASSMFSAMTLGVGVDYAIHLLERMRLYRARGVPPRDALLQAMVSTGYSLSGNTLAVAAGFGILIFSQVPANARLGGLLAMSLVNCFVATIVILPAFISRRGAGKDSADTVS